MNDEVRADGHIPYTPLTSERKRQPRRHARSVQPMTETLTTIPERRTATFSLEAAKCAICDRDIGMPHAIGEDFEYRTVSDTFLVLHCKSCGLLYLNPRPTGDSYSLIYPDHYHAFDFSKEEFGLVHSVRRQLEARRLLRWCAELDDQARILDVGCGDGFHLSILKEFGNPKWTLQGVDTDARAVDKACKRGLNVVCGDLSSMRTDKQFDLALLIMTIEHVRDPVEVLSGISDALRVGGRLVIVTDNAASPSQKLFGSRYWGGYHFPRHTYLFCPSTLRTLGKKVGFQVESVRSAVSPVNWTYSVRNWLVDWQAPDLLVNRFSLHAPFALASFTLLDAFFMLLGRGAILQGIFRKQGVD